MSENPDREHPSSAIDRDVSHPPDQEKSFPLDIPFYRTRRECFQKGIA
jgi:hypothetical protein